jgi:hypothetical protein
MYLSDGANWTNQGAGSVLNFQADGNMYYSGTGARPTFSNAGTLEKTAGGGTTEIDATLTNTGSVTVLSGGTLYLYGGASGAGSFAASGLGSQLELGDPTGSGSYTLSGALSAAAGSTFTFVNGMYTLGTASAVSSSGTMEFRGGMVTEQGSYAATGLLLVDGGTLTLVTSAATTSTLTETSGTLAGAGKVTVSGLLVWSGGTMSGTGQTVAKGGVVLNGYTALDGRSFVNTGAATWITSSYMSLSDGANWTNQGSASVLDFRADGNMYYFGTGAQPTFSNAGTLEKSLGIGTTEIDAVLTNSGTASVASGHLQLDGGGSSSGSFSAAAGTILTFGGELAGSSALGKTSNISGNGIVEMLNGSLTDAGTFTLNGTLLVDGATLTLNGKSPVTVGTFELTSGTLGGSDDLLVTGLLSWTGGAMTGTGLTNVNAGATLDINGGYQYLGLRTINNEGTDISPNAANVFVSTDSTFANLATALGPLLTTLQQDLDSQVFNNPTPMLGNYLVSAAQSQVIDRLHSSFVNNISGTHLFLIQKTLFDVFGPKGLKQLIDINGDGKIDQNDIVIMNTAGSGKVTIEVPLHQATSANPGTASFTFSLPGLPLHFSDTGSVQFSLGYDFSFTFGVSEGSRQAAVNFISASTLNVNFKATIPGMQHTGTFGFLQTTVADDSANPSSFAGSYLVSFSTNAQGNLALSAILSATANVNLTLTVDFNDPTGIFNPRLNGTFNMQWNFNDPTTDYPFGSAPSIAVNHLQLDLSSFFNNFVAPIVQDVQQVTSPLETIAQFLTTPVPIISDISEAIGNGPYYVADLVGGQTVYDLATAIVAINGLNAQNLGLGLVELGSFTLTDPRAYDSNGDFNPSTILTSSPRTDVLQQIINVDIGAGAFLSNITSFGNSDGIHFPILESPLNAFELFVGQTATLFTFKLPTVSAGVSYDYNIPFYIPPIFDVDVDFGVSLNFSASATFGYDTSGLATGHPLDGFFLQNAQVTISGDVTVGAGVGIIVAQVNLAGGVNVTVNFDLVTLSGSKTVHGSDLFDGNFKVDLSGSVTASLTFEVQVFDGFGYTTVFSWDIGEYTVWTFGSGGGTVDFNHEIRGWGEPPWHRHHHHRTVKPLWSGDVRVPAAWSGDGSWVGAAMLAPEAVK